MPSRIEMVRVACAVGDVIMTSTDDRPSIFQSCHFSLVRIYVVSSYLDTCNTASFGFRYRITKFRSPQL